MGKSLDTKCIVISLIISLIMIYIANHTAWALQVIEVFKDSGYQLSFSDAFTKLFSFLEGFEFASKDYTIVASFYEDLITGYALSLIIILPYVIGLLKSIKLGTKITKLD